MKNTAQIIAAAQRTLKMESAAVHDLIPLIGDDFVKIAQLILKSKGRLVVTGVGKSAIIAQKLVATFNSTGQSAVFMHAADASHGDLGNVHPHDLVLCISKSGDSPEVKVLASLVKSLGNPLIGMVSQTKGFLARKCDYLLLTPIEREACPHNLAPTTSTVAQLAMGDALAMALMEVRGFTANDFARYHPGGALGKKLYIKMGELLGENARPMVSPNTPVKNVLLEISSKRLGASVVIDQDKIIGIITDGDIRRMLEKDADINTLTARDIMSSHPKTIDTNELAVEGFHRMESHHITQLVVLKNGLYQGIVHLHDILKEGIF